MSENCDKSTGYPARRADETLTRLAELLHLPVEAFSAGGDPSHEIDGVAELVRLWFAISDPGDKAKLLQTARNLAAG